jgi:ssDNA-binding Zn-finger/Zn-ribbon topoisomerase 1
MGGGMSLSIEPKAEVKLGKVTHSVRAAQAILQYGVGAMVDFPDQTLMTAAPEYWGNKNDFKLIRDERLERQLDVDYFAIPHDNSDPKQKGIAYTRFPQWYFCPKCRRLAPLTEWYREYKSYWTKVNKEHLNKENGDPYMKKPVCLGDKCRGSKGKGVGLVPARIIVACAAGHIDDFPWVEWVHARSNKPICGNPKLFFKTGVNSTAGLEGLSVICESCKASVSLEHAFDKDGLVKLIPGYFCSGNMPWSHRHVSCGCIPQAKQRGALVVYYPKVDSSLVIPPYSDRLRTRIVNSAEFMDYKSKIRDNEVFEPGTKGAYIAKRFEIWLSDLSSAINVGPQIVRPILTALLCDEETDSETEDTSSEVYRQAEYYALNGMTPQSDDDDFQREEKSGNEYDIPGVIQVALLHKIREVRALIGFTRLDPPNTGTLGIPPQDQGRFQCVKRDETRWYPGYEVRGEGIFIQFDNDVVSNWIAGSVHAANQIAQLRKNASLDDRIQKIKIDAKFIFLHTLSHLLIQRLSFESGYNSASLRERIYCDIEHRDFPMCGIFIYTACGDSEGTLGGLVRQGLPGRLKKVFASAMENARWCSNDPVCNESGGQGRNAMNLAACHACALLPETSCEEFNVLLDRTLLIGRITDRSVGFFSSWLDEINKEESLNAL